LLLVVAFLHQSQNRTICGTVMMRNSTESENKFPSLNLNLNLREQQSSESTELNTKESAAERRKSSHTSKIHSGTRDAERILAPYALCALELSSGLLCHAATHCDCISRIIAAAPHGTARLVSFYYTTHLIIIIIVFTACSLIFHFLLPSPSSPHYYTYADAARFFRFILLSR
jgi:hypothetical protein